MLIWLHIIGLAILALVAGWLSGYDSNLVDDGRKSDFWRRFIRVMATLFMVEAMIFIPPLTLVFSVLIGVTWASCLSEFISGYFRRLLDPGFFGGGKHDAGKSQRYLDTVAHLIRTGQRDAAIRLCEEIKQTGEVDIITLENMLEFLGVKQERKPVTAPLAEAARLRTSGRFAEAEQLLKSSLAKNPAAVGEAMMLMRVYAQDLKLPGKAEEVLHELEKQPHVLASHIDFARRSIADWANTQPTEPEAATHSRAESVAALLEQGLFGSAIELLEEKIKKQPHDFESRLKLAEVYALHCNNFPRAEKIIRQIGPDRFDAAQTEAAQTKLKEWREAWLQRK